MEVQINNKKHYIFWKYFRKTEDKGIYKKFIGETPRTQDETICLIKDSETQQVVFEGKATTARKDNFVKESGRKVSLEKAISSLPKEERTNIWNAYLSR